MRESGWTPPSNRCGRTSATKPYSSQLRLSRKTKNATADPANLTPCVPSIFYPIRERLMHCGRGLRGNKNLDIRFTYSR
jgi:hypothetical protein